METSEFNYKKIDTSENLSDWMRSPEGLRELSHSWKSALYSLKKSDYFNDERDWQKARQLQRIYKELKEGSFVAGLSFYEHSDLHVTTDVLEVEDEETSEIKEERVERWFGKRYFRIIIHIAFSFSNSVVEHFDSLPAEVKEFLAEYIWSTLAPLSVIKREKLLWFANEELDSSGVGHCDHLKWWNFVNNAQAMLNYVEVASDGGIQADLWGKEMVEHYLNIQFKTIEDAAELQEISKCSFVELININKVKSLAPKGSHLDGSLEKLTLTLNRWEERLCSYLLEQGFIVSLEPKIFFPDKEVQNYREPDLMIFHMGRVIALEIDDRSHLVKEKKSPKGSGRYFEANPEKWARDRLMDKLFLLNGIPVLRVWYDEVDSQPEKVMTDILRVFQSLGGPRTNYQ